MRCRRLGLRRKLIPYIEGQLAPRAAGRLEKHLRRCGECRSEFVRLGEGHRLAQRLSAFRHGGAPDGPAFKTFETGEKNAGRRWGWFWERWFDVLTMPRVVPVLAAIVVLQLALLVVSNRTAFLQGRGGAAMTPAALDVSRFRTVSISDLSTNTLPHVATEGYVRDVRVDEEEKTLHFILSQRPEGPGPFVVCEIMNPGGIAVPRVGSRVRVYGV
ncbi:MAG: zf-HC2 domain-containing protein, partial [Candidatus Aminicenantales bacterium]